ncbi:hypothetical protein Tco_0786173, partial [Tanacetum coccineum]
MMGIPNEHQLKFNFIKDAKKLLEAVEKRFGRNEATKKTQRNLLKQQYENFTAPSSEMLDQTFDRLQNLVSQLELLGEKISQENVNKKLLRSLSPEWNTHAVVWRNKSDLDTMSMDDMILQQTSRVKRQSKKLEKYDVSKTRSDQAEEGPNYTLMAFSSSSPDSEVSNDSICSKSFLETVELLKSQNDQLLKDLKKSELMVLVPPPYTGNFMPPTPDLSFTGLDEFVNEPVVENTKASLVKKNLRPKEVVNVVKGNNFNAVKASAYWVWKPKHKVLDYGNPQMDLHDKGVIDSGCSRHMTGNMSYLT